MKKAYIQPEIEILSIASATDFLTEPSIHGPGWNESNNGDDNGFEETVDPNPDNFA